MRQVFTFKSFLSLGLGLHIALFAETATVNPPSTSPRMTENENQAQVDAWLKDSAQAAQEYVAGLDRGEYTQSWSKGDSIFQNIMSQNGWVMALELSRKPLGKVNS